MASATCVCGHAAAHHTRRDSVYAGLMADYRVVWRCGWKGCGCPEFVKAPPMPTACGYCRRIEGHEPTCGLLASADLEARDE